MLPPLSFCPVTASYAARPGQSKGVRDIFAPLAERGGVYHARQAASREVWVTISGMNRLEVTRALAGLPVGEIHYFASIGSTNDYAAERVRRQPPDVSLVVADEQTAGRGRAGRRWFTPRGAALAISAILRPRPGLEIPAAGNALGALAVCDALAAGFGLQAEIKWPNDVLLGGLKVAGVLPESFWLGERLQAVVLGIGVNVAAGSAPPPEQVSFPAGCVEAAAGGPVDRVRLLREIVSALLVRLEQVGSSALFQAWAERLAFRGREALVFPPAGEPVEGRVAGLTAEGHLRVETVHGEQVFAAGEVRLRPK